MTASNASASVAENLSPVGPHRLALAGAACTLALVFWGGSVTSNDAGMAFPDWPTVEGQNMFLYPPAKWVGDKMFEHTHRLLGSLVGMMMIALAVWTQVREKRSWVRRFAWALLVGVIVQGVMGGLRVTEVSVSLAIVHGCFAQMFLSAVFCMALVTSRAWSTPIVDAPGTSPALRRTCVLSCLAVFGQLIAGALYRHLGEGLLLHVLGAMVVTVVVSVLVMWISGAYHRVHQMMLLVKWLATLFVAQLALGVAAYVSTMQYDASRDATLLEWLLPSLHVVVGASILAVTVTLTVVAHRHGAADDAVGFSGEVSTA